VVDDVAKNPQVVSEAVFPSFHQTDVSSVTEQMYIVQVRRSTRPNKWVLELGSYSFARLSLSLLMSNGMRACDSMKQEEIILEAAS
jgi:hypothetical protein